MQLMEKNKKEYDLKDNDTSYVNNYRKKNQVFLLILWKAKTSSIRVVVQLEQLIHNLFRGRFQGY